MWNVFGSGGRMRAGRRLLRLVVAATAALAMVWAGGVVPASADHGGAGFEPGYKIIRTFAGTSERGFNGDDPQPATEAQFFNSIDMTVDDAGNVYIADQKNQRVRRVDPSGVMTTVAGSGPTGGGTGGFAGDGGPATEALLYKPVKVAVGDGALYIGESSFYTNDGVGNRVRKVDLSSGIITTVAGTGQDVDGDDGGLATETPIRGVTGLAVQDGSLYIAVPTRVRKVDLASGIITTVAGGGDEEFPPEDGVPATSARLGGVSDVTIDPAGNLYFPFSLGQWSVRKVSPEGIITTVAGTGVSGFSGDGGPATEAQVRPESLAFNDGMLYMTGLYRIRKVDLASGIITTVVGTGERGFSGDNGPPTEADIGSIDGLAAADGVGLLLAGRPRVRQVVKVPDLLLVTTGAADVFNVGEEPVLTVEVSNNSTGVASGVRVTDVLPDGVGLVSADPSQGSCEESDGTVVCQLGEVASAGHATVRLTVAPASAGVVATNSVSVEADQDDPFESNNSDTVTVPVGGTGCGQVVTADMTLDADIGPCPGGGLVVDRDDVTIDLNGHQLSGFRGFSQADIDRYEFLETGSEAGIRLPGRTGVTVRGGTVTGFSAGVVLGGGSGNTVEGMTLRANVGVADVFTGEFGDGVYLFNSSGNTIVDNELVGNGHYDGIAVYGPKADDNTIVGNLIQDTLGPPDGGPAGQGIIVNGATGRTPTLISGTKIVNNTVRGSGSGGIANINDVDAMVVNNVVEGNGLTNANGQGIGVQMGLAFQNLDEDAARVKVIGNTVRDNGWSGILLRSEDNKIVDNIATGNGRAFDGDLAGSLFFDLEDRHDDFNLGNHSDCDHNRWHNNQWGSAGYAPDCVTGAKPAPKSRDRAAARTRVPKQLAKARAADLPHRGPPTTPPGQLP